MSQMSPRDLEIQQIDKSTMDFEMENPTEAPSVDLSALASNQTPPSRISSSFQHFTSVPGEAVSIIPTTPFAGESIGSNPENGSVDTSLNHTPPPNTAVNLPVQANGSVAEVSCNNSPIQANGHMPLTRGTWTDLSSPMGADCKISPNSLIQVKQSSLRIEAGLLAPEGKDFEVSRPDSSKTVVDESLASNDEPPTGRRSLRRRKEQILTSDPIEEALKPLTDGSLASKDELSRGRRGLRKRKEKIATSDSVEEALKPLTDDERRAWKGWVELESDPAHFNYVLRQLGVKDVKIQEVFGLDDEFLSELPKPVYGLVFLFRYHDDDAQEHSDAEKCPERVWFANQTINNACATIALLNIIMNVPAINLGTHLKAFKESTQDLKPPYRGKRISESEFIRGIHNSFARKMDILGADLVLKNEFDEWVKTKKNTRKKAAKKVSSKKKNDEEEPGFHYVAYVPVQGEVWRLDGLQRDPVNLGVTGDSWISLARDNVQQRTMQYDDGSVEFCLLALCKCPLSVAVEDLACNTQSLQAVETALSKTMPDWRTHLTHPVAATYPDLAIACGLTQDLITAATPDLSELSKVAASDSDPERLSDIYKDLVKEQGRILAAYKEEATIVAEENEVALRRKKDFAPVVYRAMKTLAEAGVLPSIIKDLREKGEKGERKEDGEIRKGS